MLKTTHDASLVIGDVELDVAVPQNGTRIISQSSVFEAFDRPSRGNARVINVPVFIDAKNLQPLINEDLMSVINKIEFESLNGQKKKVTMQ